MRPDMRSRYTKMLKKTFNSRLSFRSSALVLLSSLLIAGTVELKALKAREPSAGAPKKFSSGECIRCHSDQKTIDVMRMKEDGTGFLFNKDGTFKDPKLAALNPNPHTGGVQSPAQK